MLQWIDIHIHTHNNLSIYRETYFPGDTTGKESTCIAGDLCSVPGLGRSRGEGHGNPFQYSCLENPMDRRDGL